MTACNLDPLLEHRFIALISNVHRLEPLLARNLLNAGFTGPVMPAPVPAPAEPAPNRRRHLS